MRNALGKGRCGMENPYGWLPIKVKVKLGEPRHSVAREFTFSISLGRQFMMWKLNGALSYRPLDGVVVPVEFCLKAPLVGESAGKIRRLRGR